MQTVTQDTFTRENQEGYNPCPAMVSSAQDCDQLKETDLKGELSNKRHFSQDQHEPEPSPVLTPEASPALKPSTVSGYSKTWTELTPTSTVSGYSKTWTEWTTDSEEDSVGGSGSGERQVSLAESEPMAEEATFVDLGVSKNSSQVTMPECLLKTVLSGQRYRKSCYFDATVRCGLQSMAPYNHMLLPVVFSSVQDEYENLKSNVCLWDVAVQRQIEVCGPDAFALVDLLTPRGLSTMKIGECRYTIMTDEDAMVINDPVLLKLAEDRYWFSIADTDMLFWVKGLALGFGFDVRVAEVAVSPLAVQGPKSCRLMQDLFGEWVADLKYYHFETVELDGIPMLLARSGWSPELGYELYLQDESRGDELWEKVWAAGQKYSIKPGAPNQIRRMEGGMLVHGSDITLNHNILELGLPSKFCSANKASNFLGKTAIQRLMETGGPKRSIMGLEFRKLSSGNDKICPFFKRWNVRSGQAGDAEIIGFITSICFTPAFDTHIAFATLAIDACVPDTEVWVELPSGESRCALVRKLPFLPRAG
jgi:glycine cleavage system aminomethyltransferase T